MTDDKTAESIADKTTRSARACEGQSTVLSAFVQHQSALRRYISRFVRRRHDIDDVAQEVFLRAFRTEKQREIEQPKSFLFKIAHNVAVTELTKKSSQILDYIEDIDSSGVIATEGHAESEAIGRQTLGIHCEAVAKLPEQCRKVYLMRKVHGMSHKEISERLGIAVSTVEKHLAKGVRLCAGYVRDMEAGETRLSAMPTDAEIFDLTSNKGGQENG